MIEELYLISRSKKKTDKIKAMKEDNSVDVSSALSVCPYEYDTEAEVTRWQKGPVLDIWEYLDIAEIQG